MTKTKILAGSSTALIAALSTFSLAASAQPVAVASGCKLGSESAGCKLNGTGYADFKSNVFAALATSTPRVYPGALTIPGTAVCAKALGVTLSVKTKRTGKVGGSVSFSGNATVQASGTSVQANVKSANIAATLQIASAKRASLSGNVEAKLTDGSTCKKKLSFKLARVLGG
ncbi:MAG TPA: hypothetical protein VGG98_05485 [Solirubrobacteraceae bacterium]|jgi:hypothetical protein